MDYPFKRPVQLFRKAATFLGKFEFLKGLLKPDYLAGYWLYHLHEFISAIATMYKRAIV
jgi:hypothetical protein